MLTVSLIFWFIGLVPDLATMRDTRQTPVAEDRSSACWRWAGADRRSIGRAIRRPTCCWRGLATPLVVSVHTVVSFDFAVSIAARLAHHDFPALLRRRRHLFRLRDGADAGDSGAQAGIHLEDLITMRHMECMAKVMLGTGLIVAYGYAMEAFMSWYSGNPHEMFMYYEPRHGPVLRSSSGC